MGNGSTWGVKVDEIMKEKLSNAMRESGMEGQDFINTLYTLYVSQIMKQARPESAGAIEELQKITQRIYTIYLNFIEQSDNLVKAKKETFELDLNKLMEKNTTLKSQIEEKEKEEKTNEENYKILVTEKSKVDLRNKEISGLNSTLEDLISQYKQKNNTLEKELSECETYKENNQIYAKKISDLEKDLDTTKLSLEKEQLKSTFNDKEIDSLTKEITNINKAAVEAAQIKENNNKKDIKSLKDSCEIDKGNALLVKDQNNQKIVQDLIDKFNSRIEKINDKLESERESISETRKFNFEINQENITLKAAATKINEENIALKAAVANATVTNPTKFK